ncbi:ACT domain-containing protein [Flavobacterium sp. W22_SRS_FP1]|uniref:ACT domain-containing protein n=1 Tax=Flavobacterium sp. W22_SRS_FP1 TaxID=3240276 RepID=UPI003F8F11A4
MEYVFCVFNDVKNISLEVVLVFKEQEGTAIIGELADRLKRSYSFIASWITLTVYSSLVALDYR